MIIFYIDIGRHIQGSADPVKVFESMGNRGIFYFACVIHMIASIEVRFFHKPFLFCEAHPQMPFPDHSRPVAVILQHIRQRFSPPFNQGFGIASHHRGLQP